MEVRWRIELLGGLRVIQGDQVITRFRTKKTGLLLAYLAYYRHRSHQREELVELLWPEGDPEAGSQSFRKALSSLRQQLESSGQPPGSVFVTDRGSVQLDPAAVTTDVEAFKAALRSAARAGSGSEQAEWLSQAVEQYRGELLPGHHEDWIFQERQWLAESYFQALSQLLAHLEQAGEYERALQYAQQGVSADPLREEAHRDLMRLYAAVGLPAAAQRQYREMERLFKEHLQTTPDAATRRLAEEIERLAALRPPLPAAPRIPAAPLVTPSHAPVVRVPPVTEPEGESRLITVLFADMSSSLERTASLPPEEAATLINGLLTAMVDVLLKYEARVDRFLGDGVLALFGTPQAHEDDPERAIRAAMEIRVAARRLGMEVTAGINTGEVYLGAVGSERHQEMTVAGAVVSLASRLQGQAEPGQILVGEGAYRQTRRAFEFSSLSLEIKGLARPVTAYAVGQALTRPEKARGIEGLRAELIGRDKELAKLEAALAAVRSGQGQMVSLIGEAGIGKSRLVAELKEGVSGQWSEGSFETVPCPRPAGHSPLLWLEGHCLELGTTTGYSLFVDLFRDYFAWRPEEDERARGQRLAASLREFTACGELAEERVEEMGPLLGNLLSVRFETDWDERLKNASPEQIRHQTFLAVVDFLVALSRRRPLLLVCEDLHWADNLSLDLISLLMESLKHAPVCLLCVYRPEREHKCRHLATLAERKCPERFTEIRLRELTPEESSQLVESLLTIENLPRPVKELILEKSRGNPFFLEEVVRSLLDSRVIYREGDVWKAREGITTVSVPESVQSMILSRVDRLRPDLKQVLQSAAVIGRLFPPRLLEHTVGREIELDRALGELEDQGLVYKERAVPEEEYSFKHVLTQETIYQSILRRHRAGFHQKVAEAMEALYQDGLIEHYEELAYHYEHSAADEKAVEYLLKAGEKAKRAYLNEAAIGYLQRALERWKGLPVDEARKDWRLAALRGLGEIYHGIGREAEAEEQFREAIAVGQEMGLAPRELVWLYFLLGEALFWQSRSVELIRIGEEGLRVVGEDTESVEAALMNHITGVGYERTGNIEKAYEFIRRNTLFLQRLPYSEELRALYDHVLYMYSRQDNVEEATAWLQVYEQKAQQHHDLRAQGDILADFRGGVLCSRGDLRSAIPLYVQALELYRKIGGVKHEVLCLEELGNLCLWLGRLQEAEEYAQSGRVAAEALRIERFIARLFAVTGTVLLCQGRWDRATDALRKAAQIGRTFDSFGTNPFLSHTLGRAYLAQGERLEALTQLQEAAPSTTSDPRFLIEVLSGLEEAHEDPLAFRAFCRRFQAEHPEVGDLSLVQWYLEPTEPHAFSQQRLQDPFTGPLAAEWSWHDPFSDCSFTVQNGLAIRAANGRDLRELNRSAPRLLRPISGDFAVQTVCHPVSDDTPALGGILLWRNKENYLRLDRGIKGPHELTFHGWLGKKEAIIGRGRLPAERLFLRLERLGPRVHALCSADGEHWFTVGHVEFPTEDPVELGLHAIGNIDRLIYPGAYPDGTAIRFESFELWA